MLEVSGLCFGKRHDELKPTVAVAEKHKTRWQVSYWFLDVASCQVASPAWPWWVCDMHTNTCTAVHYGQPGANTRLGGYLLQEKLESLLLDRQSKTESILMEKKEEIDIRGSFPGISLQQGCCHVFPLKTAHRSISWHCYSSHKIQKKIIKLWCFSKDCLGQAEVKKKRKWNRWEQIKVTIWAPN